MATNTARAMVCDWGMSDKLGMIHYGDDGSMNFFGRDMGGSRGYSEKTAEAIDAEVLHLVNSAYEKAKELIGSHRDAMEKITAALLEYETLDGKHIRDIIEHGRMLTPPPAPLLPPSNPTPKEPLPVNPPVKAEGRRRRHAPRPARSRRRVSLAPASRRLVSTGLLDRLDRLIPPSTGGKGAGARSGQFGWGAVLFLALEVRKHIGAGLFLPGRRIPPDQFDRRRKIN